MLAEITTTGAVDDEDIMTSEPKVPSKLVTALLHHHFQDDKTRVTKDAMRVYAKYLEIFVREAVARAVYEKQEVLDADAVGANTVQNTLDGYLEVRVHQSCGREMYGMTSLYMIDLYAYR